MVGALSGPTNAAEVARGLPAAMVLAAKGDDAVVHEVQAAISGPTLRVYTTDDLPGVEFGGSLKNIYAIAAGCCDGPRARRQREGRAHDPRASPRWCGSAARSGRGGRPSTA
jgi:glycerol-3-phosphate dehydrogenase